MQTFADQVFSKILETIEKFFKQGINNDVILIYTIKNKKIESVLIEIVDCGWSYFERNGYFVNGLKSYTKIEEIETKHGYIIFETKRILDVIGRISEDLENINQDLHSKITRY